MTLAAGSGTQGSGGSISMTGGEGAGVSDGGSISIAAGVSNGGIGGSLHMSAGDGDILGGNITLEAGNSSQIGVGGSIYLGAYNPDPDVDDFSGAGGYFDLSDARVDEHSKMHF